MHAKRCQKLLNQLGDGLLVLPTAPQALRNGDVHYQFRPDSDFHYLTGFPEPHAVLLAWREGPRSLQRVLFVQGADPAREVYDGPRAGVRGAKKLYGMDEAYTLDALEKQLLRLLQGQSRLFHTLGRDGEFDERLMRILKRVATQGKRSNAPSHLPIEDPRPVLAGMRLRKDAEEIANMQKAADISAAGHCRAMQACKPGMYEYEVQAELEAEFRRRGAMRQGYLPIVAGGKNACILHYIDNDQRLRRGDLLLIDAGAECNQYTADITRTFPIGGEFTPAQRAIYEVVLAAEKAGIRAVKPGAAWDAPHKAAVRVVTKGLVKLGLLRGQVPKLVAKAAYRKWFMHGSSHWLGLDVHDVGAYVDAQKRPVRFQAGMVLTVEPGLYFGKKDLSVPKEYRGIGVRIEDDVLVTSAGHRVLTTAVPKEVGEVEALCQGSA